MNIKLEELRKRLLEPKITPAEPSTTRDSGSAREQGDPDAVDPWIRRRQAVPSAPASLGPAGTKGERLHADQPRSAKPDDSAFHQQPTVEAVTPEHPTPESWNWGRSDKQPTAKQPTAEAVAAEPAPAPEPSNGVSGVVSQYAEPAAASSTEGESQLAQAVAKVFEQTQTFKDKFTALTEMFEPIERIGQAAARSLEPLQNFEQQLVRLAHLFEPMRAFQIQLGQLAQTFEPMKGLQEQLAQLSQAFQIHLNCLSDSLQPARQFQLDLLKLARVFDSVADLQAQFTQLAETFKSTSAAADGDEARPAPASVQH
jgi:hypothetical protein